jgi:hypothetical protein
MAVLAVGAIAGLPVAVHRIDMLPRSVRTPRRQASLLEYRDAVAPSAAVLQCSTKRRRRRSAVRRGYGRITVHPIMTAPSEAQ